MRNFRADHTGNKLPTNDGTAEHAHAVRPPSAREIAAILALSYAARLVGG